MAKSYNLLLKMNRFMYRQEVAVYENVNYVSITCRKKKRAQERQNKMMEKMAKMQNRFMDKIEKTMSEEGE